jgi:hypothetical protein
VVEVGGYLRRQLPAPFRFARCAAQLSSGAGIKPGLRAHLFFTLDRPLVGAELKRLLGAVPGLDVSTLGAVQPHYVAAPIFAGVDDPCLERVAVLPGVAEVEVGAIRVPSSSSERPRHAFVASGAGFPSNSGGAAPADAASAERYAMACLRALALEPAGAGRLAALRVARRLFALAKVGLLDPADVAGRVKGVMVGRGWQADEERRGQTLADITRVLEWAWEHSEAKDPLR